MMKKRNSTITILFLFAFVMLFTTGCEKSQSYSELLKAEDNAVNWYLSQKNVELKIPDNSDFKVGADAPFYKMDEDGYVYMQVINKGDMEDMPEKGDRVYIRFMRQNIKTLYNNGEAAWEGNADGFTNLSTSVSIVFGNTVLQSTTTYGDGIQVPLSYLGYNSEVNLIVKSTEGFTTDMSSCNPYIINIKYLKAEY